MPALNQLARYRVVRLHVEEEPAFAEDVRHVVTGMPAHTNAAVREIRRMRFRAMIFMACTYPFQLVGRFCGGNLQR